MTESQSVAYAVLKAAKSGDVDGARGLLASIVNVDPRPPLYWLALFECRKAEGDHETAYNSLKTFHAGLFAQHRERIGFGAGTVDQDKLETMSGPLNISNEYNEAGVHRSRGEFKQATDCLTKVVQWRIEKLQVLGYEVFPPQPEHPK